MDRNTEAQIAAARGHEPCPNCGSADVVWRGRRWHESLRRALANAIEFPFRLFSSASRTPSFRGLSGTSPAALDAHQHWRLRQAFDSRVSTMTPRIWECRSCGERGESYPEYADLAAEYGGDLERLERSLPYGSRPDQPIGRENPDKPMPTVSEINDDLIR